MSLNWLRLVTTILVKMTVFVVSTVMADFIISSWTMTPGHCMRVIMQIAVLWSKTSRMASSLEVGVATIHPIVIPVLNQKLKMYGFILVDALCIVKTVLVI